MLTDALQPLSMAALRAALRYVDVEAHVGMARVSHADVRALGRLRGALGRVLISKGAAYDGLRRRLYEAQGALTPGLELPKPFVVQADHVGGAVVLRIRLFADAMADADQVADLLADCLSLPSERNPLRQEVHLRGVRIKEGSVARLCGDGVAALFFVTPLSQRGGQASHAEPHSVLKGILRRVSGIAALAGCKLEGSVADLQSDLLARFSGACWSGSDAQPQGWMRRSDRQGTQYGVLGISGHLNLQASLGHLEPLFAIGEVVHAGAKATAGLGRYEIECSR